ncbi:MAG: UDP-glucose 4-epimerase GalE [Clostridiales bacterium]|nr:UDP-glucose 4-epimerase GalE [Clostridiales bacterium]
MTILVTGGAGYIGSHTCVELLDSGYDVIVVDNFCNSTGESIKRVQKITGKTVKLYEGDVRDKDIMNKIFDENKIDGVIHFAGLKAVGESCAKPIEYYDNNLNSTLVLLDVMRRHGCKKIVFSSSATVYGTPKRLPYDEEHEVGNTTNPYGTSKYFQEVMLRDVYNSDNEWTVILLRYFNPVGAHASGLIGEDPAGIPNNLTPYIAKVAIGELKELGVFGDDYDTPDGTGVRDYIHVVDLAKGHVAAIDKITRAGVYTYNLGTGNGSSVMEVLHAFEKACGKKIPYSVKPRRPGDLPAYYGDPSKAKRELGWEAKLDLDDMCASLWNWQSKNPKGYNS